MARTLRSSSQTGGMPGIHVLCSVPCFQCVLCVCRWLAKGATGASRWEEDSTGGKVHIHASTVSQPQPGDCPADAAPVKEPYVFSAGPRDCIGQPLARLEIQVRRKKKEKKKEICPRRRVGGPPSGAGRGVGLLPTKKEVGRRFASPFRCS